MPDYPFLITLYAIGVTFILWIQARRTRRELLGLMTLASYSVTIENLAAHAHCSKFRAWIFLIGLRMRRYGVKADPLQAGDFINIWGYRLTTKGQEKYCFSP